MTLTIPMSQKQLDRYDIIKRLIRKEINGTTAARLLRLSIRQTKRLKAKVLKQGASGLIHGSKGKPGHNHIPDKEKKRIIVLLEKDYYDFGPTFAGEKLDEDHNIKRDPKTIRRIMIGQGLWKPRSKKKKQNHYSWRQRKAAYGEMIQFDGSYEYWLEDRGNSGEICLLAAIDDATGKVTKAEFAEDEGVLPVFAFWQEYIKKNGKPRSIYLDKFSTYHQNQPSANDTLTQFQRAMRELHVEVIPANSPQAKGRVERLFNTLQDRLIKELRLANIFNISEANQFLKSYLPKFNAKFAVKPQSKADLHRKLAVKEKNKLSGILSRQKTRVVQNDFTFSFEKQWYQLLKNQPVTIYKKDKIIVEEHTDKTIHLKLRGKYLNYKILPARPRRNKQKQPWVLAKTAKPRKTYIPPTDHPWRQMIHASISQQRNSKL